MEPLQVDDETEEMEMEIIEEIVEDII